MVQIKQNLKTKESVAGYLFIAPTMVGFFIFVLIPTIIVFVLAMFKWDLISTPSYIGFKNYLNIFSNKKFINTLIVTTRFVLWNLPLQYVLSVIFALALKKVTRGQKLYRTMLLFPWITTPIAIAIVWKWLLSVQNGVLNYFIDNIFGVRIDFFSVSTAIPTIAAINIWQYVGFSTLLFFIGLQNIPGEYYEAAAVDGVNGWDKFRYITLPLLKPTIMYQTVVGIISSFQIFDTIYGTTKGGPGDSTQVYYYFIYQEGFTFLNMGYASALCVILFFILLALTLIQMFLFREKY